MLKAYPDRVCIYYQDKLDRATSASYDRHQDIEDPDHPRALLAQRHSAKEQRLLMRFLSLSREAQAYYEGLEQRRVNRAIICARSWPWSETGVEAWTGRSGTASCSPPIAANTSPTCWKCAAARPPSPGALHLTRRQDLLDLDLDAPDLSLYEGHGDEP
ncbi:MAG: hypothetical protein KF778_09805 [Rhodocyclaceae bacterium]|nr:hypothetical protein [Rhodocyclaceae bacterium]